MKQLARFVNIAEVTIFQEQTQIELGVALKSFVYYAVVVFLGENDKPDLLVSVDFVDVHLEFARVSDSIELSTKWNLRLLHHTQCPSRLFLIVFTNISKTILTIRQILPGC